MTEIFDMTPDFGTNENSSIIKVLGVGGGGSNAVAHMYKEGIKGVDFLICNTDQGHLEQSPIPRKLLLGSGLGAGARPEVARQLANESKEKIAEFIGKETQMLFITAGMGKGTGTGASPVIAEVAHSMGILTIGVVTSPFEYEGPKRIRLAQEGIEEMAKHVDSLIIIKNENILKYYQDEDILNSYGYANDVLKNACKCIAEMITCDFYQNVDFNDVKTVMTNSGRAMLGIATARGEDRIQRVVDEALACPLLDSSVITNAENFLFFISFGPNAHFTGSELKEITMRLQALQSDDAEIIHGMGVDESLDDAVKLSVIITKFDTPAAYLNQSGSTITTDLKEEEITVSETPINDQYIHGSSEDAVATIEKLDAANNPDMEPVETPTIDPMMEPSFNNDNTIYAQGERTEDPFPDDTEWKTKIQTPAVLREQLLQSQHTMTMQEEEVFTPTPLFENLSGNDLKEFFSDLAD
ncbi:MAG: cell division protein FtsZ [Bacteroidales bacterium]|nr:cell division protein FtsZ [Bacteroidales bacterium]